MPHKAEGQCHWDENPPRVTTNSTTLPGNTWPNRGHEDSTLHKTPRHGKQKQGHCHTTHQSDVLLCVGGTDVGVSPSSREEEDPSRSCCCACPAVSPARAWSTTNRGTGCTAGADEGLRKLVLPSLNRDLTGDLCWWATNQRHERGKNNKEGRRELDENNNWTPRQGGTHTSRSRCPGMEEKSCDNLPNSARLPGVLCCCCCSPPCADVSPC